MVRNCNFGLYSIENSYLEPGKQDILQLKRQQRQKSPKIAFILFELKRKIEMNQGSQRIVKREGDIFTFNSLNGVNEIH